MTQLAYSLAETILPVASRLSARADLEAARDLFQRAQLMIGLVAITLGVPLATMAPDLLTAWLGPAFSSRAWSLLQWLAAAAILHSLAIVPYFVLCGLERVAAASVAILLGAFASSSLAILLPLGFGLEASGFGMCLGMTIQLAVLRRLTSQRLQLPFGEGARSLWRLAGSPWLSLLDGRFATR